MKTNTNKVRILIADDHGMIRQGLKAVIESNPNWELCGEAENGRLAVELTRKLRPCLVLLDITMPELNGLDATRQICKQWPATKVLILTMHDSEALALAVILFHDASTISVLARWASRMWTWAWRTNRGASKSSTA